MIILEDSCYPRNRNVLKQIKFEHVHKDKISSELFTDTEATKRLFEYDSVNLSGRDSINGFIQEHNSNPFGVLLMCELQVKIKFIHKKYILEI